MPGMRCSVLASAASRWASFFGESRRAPSSWANSDTRSSSRSQRSACHAGLRLSAACGGCASASANGLSSSIRAWSRLGSRRARSARSAMRLQVTRELRQRVGRHRRAGSPACTSDASCARMSSRLPLAQPISWRFQLRRAPRRPRARMASACCSRSIASANSCSPIVVATRARRRRRRGCRTSPSASSGECAVDQSHAGGRLRASARRCDSIAAYSSAGLGRHRQLLARLLQLVGQRDRQQPAHAAADARRRASSRSAYTRSATLSPSSTSAG